MFVISVEPSRKIYRFGAFEADAASGELRKSGVRMHLQDQPFRVLLILLERSGEVITRENLRQTLWPSDTFVDFDHSLNTIINKLRETLGDSASNPRFIQTVARRGYRFLISVEQKGQPQQSSLQGIPQDAAEPVPAPLPLIKSSGSRNEFLTAPDDLPQVHHGHVRVLFLLI